MLQLLVSPSPPTFYFISTILPRSLPQYIIPLNFFIFILRIFLLPTATAVYLSLDEDLEWISNEHKGVSSCVFLYTPGQSVPLQLP